MAQEESLPQPQSNQKTRATVQAIAQYCDSLAANGVEPTYEALAKHFKASNSTISAHLKAWQQTRPDTSLWLLPDDLRTHAEEILQTVWSQVCKVAQSKLICETLELKQKLHVALAQIASCEEANQRLEEQLLDTQLKCHLAETKALASSSLAPKLEQREQQFFSLSKEHEILKAEHQKLQDQLRESELQLAHLNGVLEGVRGQKSSQATNQAQSERDAQ